MVALVRAWGWVECTLNVLYVPWQSRKPDEITTHNNRDYIPQQETKRMFAKSFGLQALIQRQGLLQRRVRGTLDLKMHTHHSHYWQSITRHAPFAVSKSCFLKNIPVTWLEFLSDGSLLKALDSQHTADQTNNLVHHTLPSFTSPDFQHVHQLSQIATNPIHQHCSFELPGNLIHPCLSLEFMWFYVCHIPSSKPPKPPTTTRDIRIRIG